MENAVAIITNRINVLLESKERYETQSKVDTKEMQRIWERLIDDCDNGISELSYVLYDIQNSMKKGDNEQ